MGHSMNASRMHKRGVLLLVVLSMLTLFMMLGTTYLIVASRARKTARAFANNIATSSDAGINSERLLDEAFMAVARGTSGTTAHSALQSGNDLLGDKYGFNASITGQISGNATGSAIIAMPTAGMASPHLLAGRVITFTMPTLTDVSTRILRADSSGNLYLPAGQTVSGAAITAAAINTAKSLATSSKHFLINGREFDGSSTNESYDAFATTSGTSDPYLAKVSLVSGTNVVTPGFGISGTNATIDNDGDGTPDSDWIDVGFPTITDISGNLVKPKAAVLVIDMDGRLNLNVHGSRTDLENTAASSDSTSNGLQTSGSQTNFYPDLVFTSTTGTTTISIQSLPRGQGVGPAEIALFGPVVGSAKSTGLGEMLGGSPTELNLPDKITGRPRPKIGGPEGRYGADGNGWNPDSNPDPFATAKPGKADTDDNNTQDRWISSSGTSASRRFFEDQATRYGSPSDLKGRMRIWTDPFGQPVYYKPYWGQSTAAGGRGLFADDDIIDDPYELNLGRSGPRTATVRATPGSPAPSDNLFSPADLEGVLRFFDPDSMRLPRRLVSICRDWAADARPLITTESWDTPAVTGKAWNDVVAGQFQALLASASAQDFFSPETIMGHKLDLNRPFHDTNVTEPNDSTGIASRQQFAKHLYCVLVAIFQKNSGAAPTPIQAEELAQWAVNVVDFRDDDSIMTPFDYDESFAKNATSWNATKRVWGCERPEILITETLAWHDRKTDDLDVGKKVTESDQTQADNDFDQAYRPRGAFFVELYSPWGSQAKQYDPTGIVDVTGTATNNPKFRGEPLPAEFVSGSGSRFDRAATINLAQTHSGSGNTTTSGTGSPVWRLVTVRGNVKSGNAFGADPFVSGSSGTSGFIVDPSRSGTTASLDRIFYFTVPPTAQRSEINGSVFWQSGTSQSDSANAHPSQSRFVVVGTDRLGLNFSDPVLASSGTNGRVDRYFDQPTEKPATISEPIAFSASAIDGYAQVATLSTGSFSPSTDIYSKQLVAPIDRPLDSWNSHSNVEDPAVSAPFLDSSGNPLLMQNGTHENFAVVHLQRLADPTKAWDSTTNPYLTVDSMPVDLTVVNTANTTNPTINATAGVNYDEPKFLATGYRYASTERGGKTSDSGPAANDSDIWNRRVNADSSQNTLTNPNAFRTGTISVRAAQQLQANPGPPVTYTLVPVAAGSATTTLVSGSTYFKLAKPSRFSATRYPWLFWANRPFTSAAEIALVPTPNAFRLPSKHTTASGTATGSWAAGTRPFNHLCGLFESGTSSPQPPDPWKSVIGTTGTAGQPGVLDFLHVPSRFVGSYLTISASTTNAATVGLDNFPINQISHFREPGRININTLAMSAMDRGNLTTGTSWNPLFGKVTISTTTSALTPPFLGTQTTGSSSVSGTTFTVRPPFTPPLWNEQSPSNPFTTGTAAANLLTVLTQIRNDSHDNFSSWPSQLQRSRDHDMDAYFRYDMQTRMANMVTTRSSVFAVWITIGYFDTSGNEIQPVRRNRAFYIFDRSIPVGYETGKDHNARDGILLRRIIQ